MSVYECESICGKRNVGDCVCVCVFVLVRECMSERVCMCVLGMGEEGRDA